MDLKCNNQWLFLIVVLLFILSFTTHLSKGSDSIYSGQSLSGNQTITSQDGVFELGIFTPGNSQNYYVGIWYRKTPNKAVVWVANRNQPIYDPSSSELKLMRDGNLVLLEWSKTRTRIWSTNSASNFANSTIAMLLDNGNFVLRDANSSNIIWQSFDHPTDTWLPGGKVGYNKLRNEKQILTSWRSSEDPAPSLFSFEVDSNPNNILLWNGSKLYWTTGLWDGKIFSLVPEIALDYYIKKVTYVSNENESFFTYEAANIPTALTRFVLDVTGQLKQFVWEKDFPTWNLFWNRPTQQCDVYAFCGAFSSCTHNVPICTCIEGFEPRTIAEWELGDHSDGCVRKTPLECDNNRGNDTFVLVKNTRLPVDSEALMAGNINECRLVCLGNCSCTAYTYDNGCLTWTSALFNLQKLVDDNRGRDLHVRVVASELVGTDAKAKPKTKKETVWVVFGAIVVVITLFFTILVIIWRRRKRARNDTLKEVGDSLVVFKFRDIRNATKNFSEKIGEGGFGSVFKGTLSNLIIVAVKSLKSLKQGEKQFRTEVSTIGMIQHINLVQLRGFCIEGTQRLLVYDYMPNGSLESHLFNKNSNILDWKTRYKIAIGTARGLSYLHEKCTDCIIHCDVKPENILLDGEYDPKVADFGLAKLVGRDFSRVLTTVRGTRGYLAPEWISGEAITPKVDVFSYGMVLFEIISGRRNRDLVDNDMAEYFPYRVANKLNQGKGDLVITLLDTKLEGNADVEELTRTCKVACWCIQDEDKNRPSMGQVVQVLEGVVEVDVPPIPRFIQGFGAAMEPFVYQETSSSSILVS